MEQLRIYTLTDKATAENYFTKHWTKHLDSLPRFGVEIKGVWIGITAESENQVMALISFPDDKDIGEITDQYMKSPEFAADMKGFDKSKITSVESKVMKSLN